MMKKAVLLLMLAVFGMEVQAQEAVPLSKQESQNVAIALTDAASMMQTMQCRFVQSKTSSMLAEPTVSEGVMLYAAPDKMRWEYTSPYTFALVVNGENIFKVTDGQAEKLDSKSGRMYQGMVDLIMGSASGKKLFDDKIFDVIFYDEGSFLRAEMTPKRRDMKRMFKQLVFRFNKTTYNISSVEFIEAGSDVTSIRFEEMEINVSMSEEMFQ